MKNKLRICMVVGGYYPMISGGIKMVSQLAGYFNDRGDDVFILTSRHEKSLSKEEIHGQIRVRRSLLKGKSWIIQEMSFSIGILFSLLREKNNYDIIYTHGGFLFSIIPAVLAKLLGKVSIVAVCGANLDLRVTAEGKFSFLKKKLFGLHDKFIGVSKKVEEELRKYGIPISKIIYLPNCVDINEYLPCKNAQEKQIRRDELGINAEKIVLFIGVLSRHKGIDLLIKAWEEIYVVEPMAKLVLVGPFIEEYYDNDFGFREEVLFELSNPNLQNSIVLIGSSTTVAKYLQAADVFVLPSKEEGLSVATLEAMSSGLAVVVSRTSGVEDMIQDGINGIILEERNVTSLIKSLTYILENQSLRKTLGENARSFIVDKFSLEVMGHLHRELFSNLLAQKNQKKQNVE